MSNKEKAAPSATEKTPPASPVKASVYECTDAKSDGGTIHTRIYCFETNRPVKK